MTVRMQASCQSNFPGGIWSLWRRMRDLSELKRTERIEFGTAGRNRLEQKNGLPFRDSPSFRVRGPADYLSGKLSAPRTMCRGMNDFSVPSA